MKRLGTRMIFDHSPQLVSAGSWGEGGRAESSRPYFNLRFFLLSSLASCCWLDNICSISFTLRMRSASL